MTVSYTVFRTHQNFNNFAAVVVEGLFLCWRTLRKAEDSVLPRRIKPVHSSSSKGEPHQERPACYSFPLQRWFVAIQILLTKHFRLFKLVHFVRKKLWWVIQLLFHFAFLVCCVYGMCTCWCGRVHVCADMGGVFHSPLVFWDDLPWTCTSLGWLVREPQGPFCVRSLLAVVTGAHRAFYTNSGEVNSGPRVCRTPTEPSFQPLKFLKQSYNTLTKYELLIYPVAADKGLANIIPAFSLQRCCFTGCGFLVICLSFLSSDLFFFFTLRSWLPWFKSTVGLSLCSRWH